MNCKKVRSLYTNFNDGSLDNTTKQEVLNHLEVCKKCNELYRKLDKITSFAGTYENLKPASNVVENILRKIEKIPQTTWLTKPRWVLVYAALAAFLFAISFGIIKNVIIKNHSIAKNKQRSETLYSDRDRYIMDYGQFDKGKVIYAVPSGGSVKIIETSY